MKKFTCYFIVLVISIFSLNITTFADYNTLNTRQLPSNAIMQLVAENENMGEIKEFHNLFNANHQISAYCIDYENGYIIYDNDVIYHKLPRLDYLLVSLHMFLFLDYILIHYFSSVSM